MDFHGVFIISADSDFYSGCFAVSDCSGCSADFGCDSGCSADSDYSSVFPPIDIQHYGCVYRMPQFSGFILWFKY